MSHHSPLKNSLIGPAIDAIWQNAMTVFVSLMEVS